MKHLKKFNESNEFDRSSIIEYLNKLTLEQSKSVIMVKYDRNELIQWARGSHLGPVDYPTNSLIDVKSFDIVDNMLVLYSNMGENDKPLTWDDLKEFLEINKDNIWEIKLCITHPYFEKKITKLVSNGKYFYFE